MDPFAELLQEHNDMLLQLKKLNEAARLFSVNGYSARNLKQIVSAMKFIEEEVRVHNRKEEKALFLVLERYVDGPTHIMRNEHKKLYARFLKLESAVERVKKHKDSFSAIKNLRTSAQQIVQLFVNHIHKENHILFPLAQRFLSREILREIAKRMH